MADSRKTESKASNPVVLARRWVSALNARDASAFETLLAPDFTYAGMARTPPEFGVSWDRETFVSKVVRGAGVMAKPVVMTIVSEIEAGERAVLEAEGHGVRTDGGVYANVYCLMFWTRDGRVTAVRDYCCTATAFAHFERLTDEPSAAQGRG